MRYWVNVIMKNKEQYERIETKLASLQDELDHQTKLLKRTVCELSKLNKILNELKQDK